MKAHPSQSAKQPQHDEEDQSDPQNAAQAGAPILAMRVISAAAAEKDYQHDNEEKGAHFDGS